MSGSRVAKNSLILYARMCVTVFISLYTTRILLKGLGVTDFGIFNLLVGTVSMLSFVNSTCSGTTQRFISHALGSKNLDRLKELFNGSFGLHLINGFVFIMMLELAGIFLFRDVIHVPIDRLHIAKIVFHAVVISCFFNFIGGPYEAVILAHENMLAVAVIATLEAVVKFLAALYILSTANGLLIYSLFLMLLSLLLLFVKGFICRRYIEATINPSLFFKKNILAELFGFASWSFLGASTSMIANYGQALLLNSFFGPALNAAHGIANQINGQVNALSNTFLKALSPSITKAEGAGDKHFAVNMAMGGSRISFFLLMIISVPLLLQMRFVLNWWIVSVPSYAIIFCQLVLIRALIEQTFQPFVTAIFASGKIKNYQIYFSLLTTLVFVVAYLLVKSGASPSSIYLAFICYSMVWGILVIVFCFHIYDQAISSVIKKVLGPCILTFALVGLCAALPVWIMNESLSRFFVVCLSGFISSILIGWQWIVSKKEKSLIYEWVKNYIQHHRKEIIKTGFIFYNR